MVDMFINGVAKFRNEYGYQMFSDRTFLIYHGTTAWQNVTFSTGLRDMSIKTKRISSALGSWKIPYIYWMQYEIYWKNMIMKWRKKVQKGDLTIMHGLNSG